MAIARYKIIICLYYSFIGFNDLVFCTEFKNSKPDAFSALWFDGTVEEAFRISKLEKKPTFLYWGAVWCPPCNTLKNQVFLDPRFKNLIRSVIPVYLDGDTEGAGVWAEKLKVNAYPTLLILDENGQELLRIAESLNFSEFERAFLASTALVKPIRSIIQDLKKGKVGEQVWQVLAFSRWERDSDEITGNKEILEISYELFQRVPKHLHEIRSVFAAKLLKLASRNSKLEGQKKETKKLLEQIRLISEKLTKAIFSSQETIIAARDFILFDCLEIIEWIKKPLDQKQSKTLYSKYLRAAKIIGDSPSTSISNKLWSAYIPLQIHQLTKGDKSPIPFTLIKALRLAIDEADQKAKTSFQRKSIVTKVAYLLRRIKAYDEARQFLEKELKTSKTPWFIQLSLARLAEEQGKKDEALMWSFKAKNTAKGKATKIQWTVNHLLLTIKLAPKNLHQIRLLLDEYYGLVFSLKDGFLGRNKRRAELVLGALKKLKIDHSFKDPLLKLQKKCYKFQGRNLETCKQHFSKVLEQNKTLF